MTQQIQKKDTAEDSDINSLLDEIEVKFKDMLNNLQQFQVKNADNVFNIGLLHISSLAICMVLTNKT